MDKILSKAIKKTGSQSKLAVYLETSRQFVSQMVKGIRPIPDRFVEKLNDLLAK